MTKSSAPSLSDDSLTLAPENVFRCGQDISLFAIFDAAVQTSLLDKVA
jgi:hypothetical protein